MKFNAVAILQRCLLKNSNDIFIRISRHIAKDIVIEKQRFAVEKLHLSFILRHLLISK